jgi:hypothetical protein
MIRRLLAPAERAERASTVTQSPILHRDGSPLWAAGVVVVHGAIGCQGGMPRGGIIAAQGVTAPADRGA